MPFYVPVGPRGILFRLGMIWTGVMGSLTYWWTNRRRPVIPVPRSLPHAFRLVKHSMIVRISGVILLNGTGEPSWNLSHDHRRCDGRRV